MRNHLNSERIMNWTCLAHNQTGNSWVVKLNRYAGFIYRQLCSVCLACCHSLNSLNFRILNTSFLNDFPDDMSHTRSVSPCLAGPFTPTYNQHFGDAAKTHDTDMGDSLHMLM